jgi:hypothetical protein
VDFLPFSKLTQQNISPRIRNVLEASYQLTWRELEVGIKATLDEFERELFRKAEKAGTNDLQNRCFEALKMIRKSNSVILIAMRNEFQRGMLALLKPDRQGNSAVELDSSSVRGKLALVDNSTLELELAISELSAKSEIKSSQALSYAAIRFAAIAGGAPVAVDDIPVGPHRILAALAVGMAGVEVSVPIKVDLLRTFDKIVLTRMPEMIEAINKQFVEQRVFAYLNLGLGRKTEAKEPEKAPEVKEEKAPDKESESGKASEQTLAQAPQGQAPQGQASQGQASQGQASQGQAPQGQAPLGQAPLGQAPQGQAPQGQAPQGQAPEQNFNSSGHGGAGAPLPQALRPAVFSSTSLTNSPQATNLQSSSAQATPPAAALPSDRFGLSGIGSTFSASAVSSLSGSGTDGKSGARAPMPAVQNNSAEQRASPAQTSANSPGDRRDSAASDIADQELFTTLRELLAGKRAGSGQGGPDAAGGNAAPIATVEDVQSILTVLQGQPAAPVMIGGRWKSRRVADIKQDMLGQLRQMHGGQTPQIEQETSDTVDLVGMLFDHVLADSKPSSTTHSLLTKLQVPILKVAIKDKSFFSRRNHPARQLLNTIAENGMFWADGDDVDQALVERMQMVVDRITADFDSDVGVFENMLGDLGRHVTTLQRKADVSEKRYVEAAKGRERLEVARKSATISIDGFVKGRMLPPLVVHLLEGAWADVLALTQLRQDVNSPIYQERLEVAEQLAGCFDLDNPVSKQDFNELKPILEEGMSLVGFHGPEIERTLSAVGELVVEGDALVPSLEPAEEREVTELVRNKARIGQDQDAPKTQENAAAQEKKSILAHLRKEEKTELTVKEQQTLDRLKQMPFGTWFEFVINQQGDVARRKLSWFSPVTGRCLFVNSRGTKVAEKTMDEMARDLVRGNAKLWEPSSEGIIDRAWRSIKDKLKNWTQSDMSLSQLTSVVE